MTIHIQAPHDLRVFLQNATEAAGPAMCALSAAESLTDEVAVRLATVAGFEGGSASRFVKALHLADFVIERNSEWHLAAEARTYLHEQLIAEKDLNLAANSLLLEIARDTDSVQGRETVPSYLLSEIGRAYHSSPLSPTEGLELYAKAARNERSGSQWLLGKLAIEQQDQGVLPRTAIEPPFLRGMTLYRDGRRREADRFLRRVTNSKEVRAEVAIACHIVGLIDSNEGLLNRSLKILETLHDTFGRAQVLHTVGHLIGKNPNRISEGEGILKQSLEIGEKIGHDYHQAQVLHSLGQLIGRNPKRVSEAEKLLNQSIEIGKKIGHSSHQAQVLHTLGQLIGRNPERVSDAEKLLEQSLEIEKKRGDLYGQAQVLHTLGQLIGRNPERILEAKKLLNDSLEIGQQIRNERHQAQVLFTLGKLVWDINQTDAAQILRRSVSLNRKLGITWAEAMVQDELIRRLSEGN